MPRKSQPTSDLQKALFEDFERQTQLKTIIKRIARAVDGLESTDQEDCLNFVLNGVRRTRTENFVPSTNP